jgi:hypothetical protein
VTGSPACCGEERSAQLHRSQHPEVSARPQDLVGVDEEERPGCGQPDDAEDEVDPLPGGRELGPLLEEPGIEVALDRPIRGREAAGGDGHQQGNT